MNNLAGLKENVVAVTVTASQAQDPPAYFLSSSRRILEALIFEREDGSLLLSVKTGLTVTLLGIEAVSEASVY